MCYKVAVKSDPEDYEERFHAKFRAEYVHTPYFHANGFSHPSLPVITQKYPDEIIPFEWGLIPSFAKDNTMAKKLRVGNLNARCDTVFSKPTWRTVIRSKRCLVLADGFYESRDVDGKKYPYYIHRADDQPFAFGGLYNIWKDEEGITKQSFSIVTTEPNDLMAKIHNIKLRMPLILPPDLERKWLQPDLLDKEIEDLMVPLEDGILAAHPVNKLINQNKIPTNNEQIMEVAEYPELTAL